ncbi:hypothetical protein LCGC14_0600280 [marine sediment metagenome]|uniref:Uncharacterized protein n=1 Tax=marine sediment metagenome TaxID=412755 RepID=A0A0F9TWW2_9ZZZZ|nr:sigma-70 family RNA polymerase sigma factor [Methylophaga sp.]HEC58341.1 sigma-70 family RNA polymerase sigma factor [Methylophaga sp.]
MKSNVKELDEQTLIAALIDGNEQAFELIVSNYHNLMLAVSRAIVGEAFADEVVQDAWMSAIKALPKFEGRSSLKTWLLHIVSNGAKSRVRRENRMVSLDDGWQSVSSDKFDNTGHRLEELLPWEEATPEALLANEQLQAAIEATYQKLPALQRAALTMYDMEGLSMEDVCNILDISASNARVLLHRARTSLHQCIDTFQDK